MTNNRADVDIPSHSMSKSLRVQAEFAAQTTATTLNWKKETAKRDVTLTASKASY